MPSSVLLNKAPDPVTTVKSALFQFQATQGLNSAGQLQIGAALACTTVHSLFPTFLSHTCSTLARALFSNAVLLWWRGIY